MNLQKLFKMQRELDSYIETNMKVNKDVFQRKGLALIVELAELANETRCFKFWSNKGASEREVILEEYVDSIHFLLSLGIEKKLDYLEVWPQSNLKQEITEIFLMTNSAILDFLTNPSENRYEKVWIMYGAIAEKLGFSSEEVLNAYISKNETNYERQKNGY